MADPRTHLDELNNAFRRLDQQWEASGEVWRDHVQREFAERYWQPCTREQSQIAKSAGQLAQALIQARRTIH